LVQCRTIVTRDYIDHPDRSQWAKKRDFVGLPFLSAVVSGRLIPRNRGSTTNLMTRHHIPYPECVLDLAILCFELR
jgi:hypothetical protein